MNIAVLGRPFAHIIFSLMFVYDIIGNNNDFGWDNAGIYAVGTFGGEAVLQLAKLRYGSMGDIGGADSSRNPESERLETGRTQIKGKRKRPF